MSWLNRAFPLLGEDGVERLAAAHVVIFGLGGVGGFCAEALLRSGVGRLTLIDGDYYDESNLNRQLGSDRHNLGKLKVKELEQHLLAIDSLCRIRAVADFYRPGEFEGLGLEAVSYVADCIDDVPAKIDLLKECYKRQIPVISAMGTGNKLDLTRLTVGDISSTNYCPLARSVRQHLRREGIDNGIRVVYSTEVPIVKSPVPASMIFVPGAAGLLMAQEIVREIAEGGKNAVKGADGQ